jgi:SAM-dependent methyltransferase
MNGRNFLGNREVKTIIHRCRICGNMRKNSSFVAREMMFGFRDRFEYFECSRCGCLQIADTTLNLSKYYPPHYYSFAMPRKQNPLKRYFKRLRVAHALGKENLIGKLLVKRYGIPPFIWWVKRVSVGFEDAILDVGCGRGSLLLQMQASGFSDLTGIEPYIEDDLDYRNGVRILRRTLPQFESTCDFVMLHHSFEHLPAPFETLKNIHRILGPSRYALIRTPVARSSAWRTYGVDWVQLDAPRHLFLHTEESIKILAKETAFEVADVFYDSTAVQFWGSEQYRRDIPLDDERSYAINPKNSIFTREEIERFWAEANCLNEKGEGDQACFYLRKV